MQFCNSQKYNFYVKQIETKFKIYIIKGHINKCTVEKNHKIFARCILGIVSLHPLNILQYQYVHKIELNLDYSTME